MPNQFPEASSSETAQSILDVAEVLFAEHGFEGTSLRMITAAAGTNLAAVNYHFGSKDRLFHCVFHRRLAQLNQARLQALSLLENCAEGRTLTPREILDAFFQPAVDMTLDSRNGGAVFMRLLGRTYTAPALAMSRFIAEEYDEVMKRYLAAAYRALPHIEKSELTWRLHFMAGAATYAISGVDALALIDRERDRNPAGMKERLITFFLDGLGGPIRGKSADSVQDGTQKERQNVLQLR